MGDEILEINGTNVTNHSVDQLQKAMVSTYMLDEHWDQCTSFVCQSMCALLRGAVITSGFCCSAQEMTFLCFHLVKLQSINVV